MPIVGVLTHTMTPIATTTKPSTAFNHLSVDTSTPPSSALSPITPKAVTSSEHPTLINGFGVSMPVESQLLRRFEASLGQIPGLKYPSINTLNKPLEEIVSPSNLETSISSIPSLAALVNVGNGEDSFVISPCIEPNPSGTYVHSCASKPSMCPQGTFCQIGAASQQSVCCPIISKYYLLFR
uniref:Clip domain-containing protein n=1 Tax=Ascaris lumbricoides TaxID=6252 RepID=A0A0M3ICS7_ASCLU